MDLARDKLSSLLKIYCLPAVIGMFVQTFYNLIDRIFVGHIQGVGDVALTAIGIVLPIMTLLLGFGLLFGTGTRARISLLLGKKEYQKAEELLGNMVSLTLISSILLSIIGVIFLKPILLLFGADKVTLNYAKPFLFIILLATPFNLVGFSLNKLISPDGHPKLALYTQFFGAGLNILLDPIFIFVFHLGVSGAAIATAISQVCAFLWCLYYFVKYPKRKLSLKKKYLKIIPQNIWLILSLGFSQFFMQLLTSGVQIIANRQLLAYGSLTAVGAMTVIQSISLFFTQPIYGINQGTQPIIGFNYGQKNYKRSLAVVKYANFLVTIWASLGWLLIEIFPRYIIPIFSNSVNLNQIAIIGIRLYLGMLFLDGFQIIIVNFFQAIGNVKLSIFLALLRQGLLLIPLILILPIFMGIKGIWLAGSLADLIAFIITLIIYLKNKIKSSQN